MSPIFKEACYKCFKNYKVKGYYREFPNPFSQPANIESLQECLDCQLAALDPFSKVKRIVRYAQSCKQPVSSGDSKYKLNFELKSSEVAE